MVRSEINGAKMSLTLVTSWGEEHGMVKEVANSVQERGFERFSEKDRVKMEKLRKEEARTVKVRYINYRGQNERLTKPYMRWAGDPIRTYHLIPGHEYTLPMGFVTEVNSNAGLATRSEKLDRNDRPLLKDGQPEKIHELVPVMSFKESAA